MSSKKYNRHMAEKRTARAEAGLCTECGLNSPKDGIRTCDGCAQMKVQQHKERRNRYRAAGIYEQCAKFAAVKSPKRAIGALCEMCWLKQSARIHLGTSKRWTELRDLFLKQNICPSLDHKIPLSEGGSNDLDNLQWVYNLRGFDVNRMKGEMKEIEFKLASAIVGFRLAAEINENIISHNAYSRSK